MVFRRILAQDSRSYHGASRLVDLDFLGMGFYRFPCCFFFQWFFRVLPIKVGRFKKPAISVVDGVKYLL